MVDERLTDGRRIGQLLASEITGNEGRLRDLALTDADPDVEPTPDGALAYRVVRDGGGSAGDGGGSAGDGGGSAGDGGDDESDAPTVAEAYVQPDRLRLEFVGGTEARDAEADSPTIAADTAGDAGLRVRPKAVRPPRTLVFVEDGAEVKRALAVFEAVVAAIEKRA